MPQYRKNIKKNKELKKITNDLYTKSVIRRV